MMCCDGTRGGAVRPRDFRRFAAAVLEAQGLRPARHQLAMIDALERVAAGQVDRLMVQMPPGAAKSTYASVLFPAFWFTRHPAGEVIAASHTASLAEYFGRRLRALIAEAGEDFGLLLDAGNRAAGRFSLQGGGQYFAAGVRGPITGRRADLILIDDPVKSWAEADSRAARDALHDWYRAELLSRLKPGGRVVLVMTRWHEDDLAGRLMARESGWTVLRLPALAEADDPLGRAPGEALWPEWEDARAIARRRATVGERVFAALYQQRPMRDGGTLFELDRLGFVDAPPAVVRTVRAWDLAATAASAGRNPDWTVGLKLGLTADGTHVVLDVVRVRAGPAAVEALLRATAEADGRGTAIALPQDPGQAGVAQVAHLRRVLDGFTVIASPESGSKQTRAMPAAARIGAGGTRVVRAGWTDAFLAELRAFPDGEKDDQVDALARAEATLGQAPVAARMVNFSLMGR
ncbi:MULTISPECIES: phage terminase large subunit [unclassified Acidiphilium]|uniref:phage terminase large subunit n=1 Tax=unclassified Acidiphilium TaxID=2617493 RepID=UPI000461F330|nr:MULTISPECIES: phage terminase large subunit [unclassified Acidiphilium]KDM66575.1 putative phage large terminase [Acidiphilium sp. JA12-A1]